MKDVREATKFVREIRDPVHRYVKVTAFEARIVDSSYFQRLAYISQMHSAHLVYPGAQYPRKIHCMGAAHLAHRLLARVLFHQHAATRKAFDGILFLDAPVERPWMRRVPTGAGSTNRELQLLPALESLAIPGLLENVADEREAALYLLQMARLAALLHDVGHGPFSHLFEAASREKATRSSFDHEEKGIDIIRNRMTRAVNGEAALLDAADAELLGRIIDDDPAALPDALKFLHQIISGPLDVDKMDYILRDSYYAGTPEYGTIDVDRILDGMVVVDGQLLFASDSLDAVISALNGMFFMYNAVYLHKAVRGFDLRVRSGLSEIAPLLRSFQADSMTDEFLKIDERNFQAFLERRARERPSEADSIRTAIEALERLRRREKFYKTVTDEKASIISAFATPEEKYRKCVDELRAMADEWKKRFKKDFHVDLQEDIEKDIRPIGLNRTEAARFLEESVVYDVNTGTVKSFAEYSPHYKTLTRIVIPVRLFAPYGAAKELWRTREEELRRFNDTVHAEIAAWEYKKVKQTQN